jgi:hypothetical protein
MIRPRALAVITLTMALAALVPGCSQPTASVSGEITYEGQPVGKGYITFTPSAGQSGKDAGAPIADGRYAVASLPPGRKWVRVIAVKKVNFASTSAEMAKKAADARQVHSYDGLVDSADTIPEDAEGNGVEVDIQAGANSLDFHLKKPVKN